MKIMEEIPFTTFGEKVFFSGVAEKYASIEFGVTPLTCVTYAELRCFSYGSCPLCCGQVKLSCPCPRLGGAGMTLWPGQILPLIRADSQPAHKLLMGT